MPCLGTERSANTRRGRSAASSIFRSREGIGTHLNRAPRGSGTQDACDLRRLGSRSFCQDGGPGGCHRALPRALERQGHTTAVFLPAYRCVRSAGPTITHTGIDLRIEVGSESIEGSVYTSIPSGSNVPFYLIDQPRYFDRGGIYGEGGADYPDNAERFIFFNLAVLEAIQSLGLRPDVIHCNDWQTGLVPVYLKTRYQRVPALGGTGSLLTIHNLAYLGLFPHCEMGLTGLDWRLFNWRQLEFHGEFVHS